MKVENFDRQLLDKMILVHQFKGLFEARNPGNSSRPGVAITRCKDEEKEAINFIIEKGSKDG